MNHRRNNASDVESRGEENAAQWQSTLYSPEVVQTVTGFGAVWLAALERRCADARDIRPDRKHDDATAVPHRHFAQGWPSAHRARETYLSHAGLGVTWGHGELYAPTNGRFSNTGSRTEARERHSATLLPDGRVLIAGGLRYGVIPCCTTYPTSAELYDPESGTFPPTG